MECRVGATQLPPCSHTKVCQGGIRTSGGVNRPAPEDFGPPTSALRLHLHGLVPETGGFEAHSQKGSSAESHISCDEEGMRTALDRARWWDNRRSKPARRHSDFWHKMAKVGLWVGNWQKSASLSPTTTGQEQGSIGKDHLEVVLCRKLCEDGRTLDAVDVLSRLVQRGCRVPNNLIYRVLQRCIAHKDLVLGRRIHALTIKSGYEGDEFLATHLIGLYATHGRLKESMGVFAKVSMPSAHNWASIIFAYARHGGASQAIRLYRQMRESTVQPTDYIYVAVLKACATAGDLLAGKEVHAHIIASPGKPNIFVQTGLIDMYAKCMSLEDARRVFDRLPERNVVTWNALLTGYAQQGMIQDVLSLYSNMLQEGLNPPDSVTFVCLMQACASVGVGALGQGKQLHSQIEERGLETDVVLGGSLVNMYAKCGSLGDARSLFDRLLHKDVVTWNVMLAGYAQQGMGQEALSLYYSMQQDILSPPDSVTYICLLQACASIGVGSLDQGKLLHAQIEEQGLESDIVLGGSLVNMYVKCGSLEDACSIFDRLPVRNVVTWTALIAGYAEQGMAEEALCLYSSMQQEGITTPNPVTFLCVLQACAILAALPLGKQLHAQIEERGLQGDPGVGAALVNMYAKCGSMLDAQQLFDSLPERTIEAWKAVIGGYALQGNSEVVFDLVERMRVDGIKPDGVTFVSVLTVCSHVGLVDKGRKYFEAMTGYGISPTVEHYTCMMDLLGRAGYLDEALQMGKNMPLPADGAVWLTLLGACRKWTNVEIGQQAFEFAVRVDENDTAAHVLMSNIYASAEMWEETKAMQARRKKLGAWKKPGQSWWTDVRGVVHTFGAGDKKHSENQGINERLENLFPQIGRGCVPQPYSAVLEVSDVERKPSCVRSGQAHMR